jgi:hypothetical protein
MKKIILIPLLLATILVPMIPRPAQAWTPFEDVCKDGAAQDSAVCKDKDGSKDPITGSDGILIKITNLVAIIAGVAATIVLILAGLRFIQSSGNSEEVAGARRTIIYASVGLVVIVLARTLIVLVIAGLR